MPGLRGEACGIGPDHGLADLLAAGKHRPGRLTPGIEQPAIERREQRRRIGLVGFGAAAEALQHVGVVGAIADAQAGGDQRGGDALQVGKFAARGVAHPAQFALLQSERPGGDLRHRVDPLARRSVGVEQEIARGRAEAERQYRRDS